MATRFLLKDYIQSASLSTNPEVYENLPVSNVKKLSKSLVMRSKNNTSLEISGRLAGSKATNAFIIAGHNFTEGTLLQFYLYSDILYTTLVYTDSITITSSTSSINGDLMCIPFWYPIEENTAAFKLQITNSYAYPLNYFQIYRLMIGEYIESNVGASLNNIYSFTDNSKQYRTDGGSLRTDKLSKSKTISFNLANISEIERHNLQTSLAYVGKRKEFYITVFNNSCNEELETDYSGIVKLLSIPKYSEYAPDFYSGSISVEEV